MNNPIRRFAFNSAISRFLSVASITGLLLAGTSHSASIVSFNDGVGAPTATSIIPGDTFTFTLSLSTTVSSIGLTYFLETVGAGNGFFRITARTTTGTTFSDLASTSGAVTNVTSALLDPRNNNDLGGGVNDPGIPNAPSASLFLATYSIQSLPGVPFGTYTIQLSSNSIVTDDGFGEDSITNTGYTVVVAPEPTSTALMVVGLVSLASRRRRQAK